MSILGMLIGLIIGIILVLLQDHYHFIMINPSLPQPVKLTFQNIIIVVITMTTLSYIASKIAGSRINKSLFD